MKIDKISEKICEEYKKQELNRQEFLTEIKKHTTPKQLACEFTEEFTRQINRPIRVENQILITKLNNIKRLLNDLYDKINGNYIETLGRYNELAIDCAEAQLQLIKEIIDRVEKQVNTLVLKKNSTLTNELHGINQLLIKLYEKIDKYTKLLEKNDKLSMNCAKSELDLITKILKEVEKI